MSTTAFCLSPTSGLFLRLAPWQADTLSARRRTELQAARALWLRSAGRPDVLLVCRLSLAAEL